MKQLSYQYRLLAGVSLCAIMAACSTAPTTPEGKDSLNDRVSSTLADMKSTDSSLDGFLNSAYGETVFPEVGKGGAGIGGAYGRGEVYEQGKLIGYADVSQGSIGAQLGGQTYAEIIAFQDKDALDRFKSNRMEFEATASAVALKSGAAAAAKFTNGVAVFVKPTAGLMAEASIGGQQFTYQAAPASSSQ